MILWFLHSAEHAWVSSNLFYSIYSIFNSISSTSFVHIYSLFYTVGIYYGIFLITASVERISSVKWTTLTFFLYFETKGVRQEKLGLILCCHALEADNATLGLSNLRMVKSLKTSHAAPIWPMPTLSRLYFFAPFWYAICKNRICEL